MTTQNNAASLRTTLKRHRAEQNPIEARRGALLIRGRLFTWLATTRDRLRNEGRSGPRHIAAFWSLEAEPELQPLLGQWVEEEDLTVSLPVVRAPDARLEFHRWTPDTPMRAGPYGIMEPEGPPAPPPDLILVPTLGFTRSGDRVGYGKGYYDRTLAALRSEGHVFTTIGIAWACGDLSGVPYVPAPHDVRMDAILTDKGWAVPAPTL